MTTRSAEPILVVGAGPTGLMMAAELARHGAAVRIVEKRAGVRPESRALGIHAGALEMLDRVGLADEFVARGQRVRGFSMWDRDRLLVRIDYGLLDTAFPFLLDIPQAESEAILRRHLSRLGVAVEESTEVVGLRSDEEAVVVTARRPGATETIRAPYVVGCDGAHSAVRHHVGLSFEGHGYPDDWLLADVALAWDRSPDDVHVCFSEDGRAVVCMPMTGGRWRVILYFAGDRGGRAPSLGEVAELVSRRVPGRLAVSDPTWLARFQTHRRSAPAYRRGRVFLAGDAVHIHSPAGGQGMNTGLLDAHNLGWKLAAVVTAGASPSLLDSYEAERAPVAREVLGLSHNLVRLSAMSTPLRRAARALAVPLAARLPGFRARVALRMSQLYVDYRSSPLTGAARPPGRGPRPGDRAPDAAGLGYRGRPARLHELLRATRHTLLVLDPRHAGDWRPWLDGRARQVRPLLIAPDVADWADGLDMAVDATGETRRRYGGGGLHLVRPDGYLAASGLEAIDAYLGRVYGCAVTPRPRP